MAALLHPTNSRSSSSSSAVPRPSLLSLPSFLSRSSSSSSSPATPTPLSRTTLSPKVTLITASEYKELHAAYTGESLPVKQVFPWMHKGAEVEGSASWRYFSDGKGGRGVARPEYRGLTTIFCPALPPSPSSSPTSSPTKLSSHARKHSNTKRQQPVPHAPMMGSSFSAYSSDEDGVSSSESEFSDDEDEDPTLHSPTTTLGSSRPSHELISSYPSSLLLSPLSQSFLPPAFDPKPHVVNLRGFRDVPLKYARLSDIVVYSREGLYLGVEGKGEVGEVDITKVVYGEELRLNENLVETANLAVKAVEKEASAQNKRRGGHVAEERRVWVVIDSFETFEAHHPELVAIDSEGYHRNKLDWFAREKEEMRVLTEGSEIGRGVYLGNSQDVPLPPPVKRGMREGSSGWESENSSVEGETGYGGVGGEGENERGVAICIEAHESAKMPSPHKLQDADDHLSSYEETLEQNTWVDVAISSAATISSRPASPSSTYPSSGNHTAKRTTTTLIPPNSSLVHLSVPSTLSHLNPTQLSNAINGLINLLSFIHSQSNPPPHAHRLPRRVLMHCGDGYTETSLLALSYVMYERRCTLPEAYLVLQREGRSFFVYPAEVKVLLEVERRVSEFWEREDRMRGVSGEKEGEGESSGMERSDSGFVDGDGVAELEWARLMKVKQADKKQVVQEKQDAMKTSCPVEYPWFFSENWEGHFPSRILPFLYLGNLSHARNALMLKELGITHVVSMGESALDPPRQPPFSSTSEAAKRAMMPTNSLWLEERLGNVKVRDVTGLCDDGIDDIRGTFEECLPFIDEARRSGGKVLVHCRVGVSRSATIVIAYLMQYCRLDLASAYLLTRSRRLNILIQPNLPFAATLHAFEAELLRAKDLQRQSGLLRPEDEDEDEDVLSAAGLKWSNRLAWSYFANEIAVLNSRFLDFEHPFSLTYVFRRACVSFVRFLIARMQAVELKKDLEEMSEEVVRTKVVIPVREEGGARMIKAERYEVKGTTEEERKGKGVHINFHGSGFIIPSLGSDLPFCASLASKVSSTYTVYDVDYRKAPETPFPGPLNDALDAVSYLLDPSRSNGKLSLSGFSAGGNLAMTLAITLEPGMVGHLAVFYGNADMTAQYPPPVAIEDRRSGVGLVPWMRTFFYNCYILPSQLRSDVRLSPIKAGIERWPKHVWACCGDADDLWESDKRLVEYLKEGGVEAEFVSVEKGGHGFDKSVKGEWKEETMSKVEEVYAAVAERLVRFG